MNIVALIIFLVSLALAVSAAYFFLQWKCPTRLEKLTQITEETKALIPEEKSDRKNDFDPEQWTDSSPAEIRQAKSKLIKIQKELKKEITETQEKIKNESDEDKKTKKQEELEIMHELTPKLAEIASVVQPVEKKEDLSKKFYGIWDYVYAGSIAAAVFLISGAVGNLVSKKTKGEGE